MSNHDAAQPLNEIETRILMVLARADLHGYGIAKALEESDDSAPSVLPTNLYRRLHELVDRGLIDNAELTTDESGRPRKNFTLTEAGHERLETEAERLSALVREIESRTLPSPHKPAE